MQKAKLIEILICKISEKATDNAVNSACSGFFFQEQIPKECMLKYRRKY